MLETKKGICSELASAVFELEEYWNVLEAVSETLPNGAAP